MQIDEAARRRLIRAIAVTMIAHEAELTRLDQAIGDGDHGPSMRRGFQAVLDDLDRIAAEPLPRALQSIGTTLVMKVGGASGPLFGTLYMAFGKALPEQPIRTDAVAAFAAAIEAVKARGKADIGEKTMLDVLVPVLAAARAGTPDLPAVADAAAEATRAMQARRGRAASLVERSVGHVDPGARSAALMVRAVLEAIEGSAP
jgi:dihydroxyacetone kinase-like protein